ncbi:MAG: hypothetical protein Tsb002_13240 [Wenzhouxiangellaceae bacterium]
MQMISSDELTQPVRQVMSDLRIFIPLLGLPLLLWILIEYQNDKKLTNPIFLLTLIVPAIMLASYTASLFTQGLTAAPDSSVIITNTQRLGSLAPLNRTYRLLFAGVLLAWAAYAIHKKTRNNLFELALVSLTLATPMLMMYLKSKGIVSARLGAPFWSLLLLWGTRQYRLLDPMPVALPRIVEQLRLGLVVLNQRQQMVYLNEFAGYLLSLENIRESLSRQAHDPPDLLTASLDLQLKQPQSAELLVRPDSDRRQHHYLDVRLEPIFNSKQQFLGFYILLHDITQQKSNAQKLARHAEQLEATERQKSRFFAGISHEFRTPLTLSLGTITDITEGMHGPIPETLLEPLARIKRNDQRLLKLVRQLLDLSLLDSGAYQPDVKRIDLKQHLPMLISAFEDQARRQQVSIEMRCDDESTDFYFDPDAFAKVISNLLSNALKSMREPGTINIQTAALDAEWLQLTIQDSGCGMPPDVLPHIFQPFYYHDSHHELWPAGTGVGLSLVQQLVSFHGGEIEVESQLNAGSIFRLKLRRAADHFKPAVSSNAAAVNETSAPAQQTDPLEQTVEQFDEAVAITDTVQANRDAEKLILIVEDNADMRRYIRSHLDADFRLMEAADGGEGLQLAREVIPDLILADQMMPVMNGLDLCRQIKQDIKTSHIPVLILTAKSTQDDKLMGLEQGADDYLTKPFDTRELITRIRNLMSNRDKWQQYYLQHSHRAVAVDVPLPAVETTFLDKLTEHITEHISEQNLYVADLASTVNMSERNLTRKLKALTGQTPKQLLQSVRLESAARMLTQTELSITEISHACGFYDASYFARKFKDRYTMSPKTYKNRQG